MTVDQSTRDKAERLRALGSDSVLVLPNAWDAGSAAVIAAAGALAIGTTSGGVAWSLGRGDGERAGRDEMIAAAARIAAAVDVPVTVDIEAGYGAAPDEVAKTVTAVVAAGAVGANLEDSKAPGGPLFTPEEQAARIAAARTAAAAAGLPELLLNVRTDVYLFGIGEESGRLDDVLARTAVYADAGADGIFVPGLLDLAVLGELAARSPLPVNVMAGPGGPGVAELAKAGVRRISVGTAITQAAYTAARRATLELLGSGTYEELAGSLDFFQVDGLFHG
ncbi:isocitrate lyase/phosphoenolpyruvate mutase family protein [Streptomyces sp. NPDC048282]|uniref:isocitrate lyase/PEP mutase family protein n=1 Tax=Streptomyces sp. NPDC048282 TaxID=3365528 RepID=UPI00371B86DE